VTTSKPILTLDLDGVICAPILGLNLGISTAFLDPALEPPPARVWPRWLGGPLDAIRFGVRRPLAEAQPALQRLALHRTWVVVTGRRADPRGWLERYGLDSDIDAVRYNQGPLRSAHFKLGAIAELGAAEHIDDDGRTAQLIAQASSTRSYLRDWPRNRGVDYDAGVTRVSDLAALADAVEGASLASDGTQT
jgi:hypothetical protein